MTRTSKENNMMLARILCNYYLLHFCKDKKNKVQALINFGSRINTITLAYASKLGFKIRYVNVRVYKIDNFIFKIFKMVLASF